MSKVFYMKSIKELLPTGLTIIATILIVLAIAFSVLSAYVATQRTLTGLEGALLQVLILLSGLGGSFIFGQQSAKDAAREIIKPHARSAFRRLLSLYFSLSRVTVEIRNVLNSEKVGTRERVALERLDAIVIEQLTTADHALEDWRDIIPEDVKELYERLAKKETEVQI